MRDIASAAGIFEGEVLALAETLLFGVEVDRGGAVGDASGGDEACLFAREGGRGKGGNEAEPGEFPLVGCVADTV